MRGAHNAVLLLLATLCAVDFALFAAWGNPLSLGAGIFLGFLALDVVVNK